MFHAKHFFLKQLILISILVFLFSSCKEEQLDMPGNFIVSQGSYLGVVHFSWDPVAGAQNYNIERQDPETSEWKDAATTSGTAVDDYGFNLPDNKIVPGKHYKYRISAGSSDKDDSGYINSSQEGWTYVLQPVIVTASFETNGDVTVSWTESNLLNQLKNFTSAEYTIFRKNASVQNFVSAGTTQGDTSFTDNSPGDDPQYKVEAKYHYSYQNMDYGTYEDMASLESEISIATGNSGPGTVAYTPTELSNISSTEGISFAEIKSYNDTQYLGIIKDADAAGKGSPVIYKLNGTSWQAVGGTYPEDIMNETSLGVMNFAVDDSHTYLAGLSFDSLYIYSWNGSSWSDNMALNNMDLGDSPSEMDIESISNTLYLAATLAPDQDLKVLKWSGSDWVAVGGDANGWIEKGADIFDLGLENIGGTLYMIYSTKNSEFNSTVHIKHLSGTTWNTDLDWTADNIIGIKLAANSTSSLYFSSNSQQHDVYPGGVYKVLSTSTVENLISSSDTWFLDSYKITVNDDDNVFIVSDKLVSDSEIYPAIYNYNGNKWTILSGDFSSGTHPVTIHASGGDIYYTFGDATNLTTWNAPKALKSVMFSK
jgi:hypothetical protein